MKYILAFILTFVLCLPIFANEHRFGFQASTAYFNIVGGNMSKNYGVAADVGFVYEWQYNRFLLQTGANLEYSYNTNINNQYSGSLPNMLDSDNDVCNYLFSLDNKRDRMHAVNIAPHIAIGGQWDIFYFLMGLRWHLDIFETVTTNALLTTTGEYENLIIPLQNMSNHYFVDSYPLSGHKEKNTLGFNGNISIMGEFGIEIPNYRYWRIQSFRTNQRVALYVEYNFYSYGKQAESPLIDFNLPSNNLSDIDFEKITIRPLYHSNMLSSHALNRISIGVRWSILFEIPTKIGCNCYRY